MKVKAKEIGIQYRVKKTAWGFYSIIPLPTFEELARHYQEKYYQNEHGSYQHRYTNEELEYFNIEAEVTGYLFKKFNKRAAGKLLDVGAGEGFFAQHFYRRNWDVVTCDFSIAGMKRHNPDLLRTMIQGDLSVVLDKQIKQKNTYDLINLKNVLEHVLDPVALLKRMKRLLARNALLRIQVPNDYSSFQTMLLERGFTKATWFSPPEHVHYFNFKSLANFLTSLGYTVQLMLADFPIELFLTNKHANYARDRKLGKAAHQARVTINNYMYRQGVESYIDYYRACAEVDFGRQVIVFASKKI
jgi:2-polyprenyl-3-methyl-5-hydroxy-6-metoxy-1,4-benzoquinol methylase